MVVGLNTSMGLFHLLFSKDTDHAESLFQSNHFPSATSDLPHAQR